MSEPGVRAVVLHGDGPSFCSGIDVMSLRAASPGIDGLPDPLRADAPNWFQRAAYDWIRVPVPVIAAVHGNCFGGGLQIALAADIRFADARRAPVGDGGQVGPRPRHVDHPDAPAARRHRCRQGADLHRASSADEAEELGVVTHVASDPLDGRARAGSRDRRPVTRRGPRRKATVRRGVVGQPRADARARGLDPARPGRFAQPACRGQRRAIERARVVERPVDG